jgi:hypothetical protein
MTLILDLSPELERQLRAEADRVGQDAAALARALVEEQLATVQRSRNQSAVAHLKQWLAEPPNEEDDRWPALEDSLNANRDGQRKLFSE